MKPILCVTSNIDKCYNEFGFLSKLKDKRKIKLLSTEHIKELGINVTNVRLPPNFNKKGYLGNLTYAKRLCKCKAIQLSPKTLRPMDYNYFNLFQKQLLAYSVVKSIKLLLRLRNKSIKNCCIVVYDAVEIMNYNIIVELAKQSKYIVFLSWDLVRARKFADYIIANFGVSPIVTDDEVYAIKIADFIISSKDREFSDGKLIWFLDNSTIAGNDILAVNDVCYNVPWSASKLDFSIELLGAILCQMQETDIERALKYNGIYIKQIRFNNNVIC
ncbi:hypothetical protein [Clostridium sp.]|jgi:hypothetical protein|uniref:hypothetical protein n=1 Tax=Clostridium sp. TaxID=1506 RepID=UPI003EEBBB85